MADESRINVSDLVKHVRMLGGEAERGSTTMGRIYRAWMGVKATFTGTDRASILASCEFGEDQAQKAYKDALETGADIDTEARLLIIAQQAAIKESHDDIKRMRDVSKAVDKDLG